MITNPTGIDIYIQNLQTQFLANLFTGKLYSSNGRAFLNERNGLLPEVYLGSGEYGDVFTDDAHYDAISFFVVSPSQEFDYQYSTANVSIYFFVNLSTLFSYTHRAVEEVHLLVLKEINKTNIWKVLRLVTSRDAIKDFAISKPELLDMQPYYCFKFECSINYKLSSHKSCI
ncbi:hypothetical protein D4R99_01565 [bacterium]|nr:MAG: hypothetical protein D4R99_01565 [bacterium]